MELSVDVLAALTLGAVLSFSIFFKERVFLAVGLAVFSLTVFVFLGARESYVGKDTANYLDFYYWVKSGGVGGGYDYFFEVMVRAILSIHSSIYFVQGVMAVVFSFFLGLSIVVLLAGSDEVSRRKYAFAFSVVLLFLSPIGFEMVANATRQGLAAPFIFLFYYALWNRKFVWSLMFGVIAASLHQSAIPFCMLGLLGGIRLKQLLLAIAGLTLIYLAGLNAYILSPVVSVLDASIGNKMLEYGAEAGYRFGPRPDFAIFTWIVMFPILYIAVKEKNPQAEMLAKMAVIMFIPFLVFGVASFVQRWLLYSWLFMAIANGYVLAAIAQRLRVSQWLFFLLAFISPAFLFIYSNIKVYY